MKANCYKVEWMYHEVGWGNTPNGESYHKTIADAEKYIQQVLAEERENIYCRDYSYPDPEKVLSIIADKELLRKIGNSIGYRVYEGLEHTVKYKRV